MVESFIEIKKMLCKEVDRIAEKRELNTNVLESIHKLAETIKDLNKIIEREEGGYSSGDWSAHGTYGNGASYRGERYYYDNGRSIGDDYSGARHYVRGHYSETDAKSKIRDQLEDAMKMVTSERDREKIREAMNALK